MSWPIVQLQVLALQEKGAIVSGPFGSNIGSRFFVEQGVPVIRGNNLTKGYKKFIDDGFVYLTDSKAAEFPNCIAKADDIVFTAAGSIGQVGLIPRDSKFDKYIISNKQLRVRLNQKKADPLFVYYWLSSKRMIQYLEGMNNGGAVPLINLGIIRKVPVPLPEFTIQRRIADILSAYDDLIENNRRRIQLLEQAARLLYKEWFVHLRFPGHEHVKIKGGVPEGWEKKPLGDIAPLKYGKALKKDDRVPGPYPVYGSSGIVGAHNKALVSGSAIIVGRKGNVGSVYWSEDDFHPIDTVYFIDSGNCNLYLYYALLHIQFINTDVAVPGLNRDFAHSRLLLVPDTKMLRLFDEIATPIHEQIVRLDRYNRALSRARDMLLPRLMNGSIAV